MSTCLGVTRSAAVAEEWNASRSAINQMEVQHVRTLGGVLTLLSFERSALIDVPFKASFNEDVVSAIAREIHSIRQQLKYKDDAAKKYKEACRTLKVTRHAYSYAFCNESMSSINTHRCRVDSLRREMRFGQSQRTCTSSCTAHGRRSTMTKRTSIVSKQSWIELVVCSASKVNNDQQTSKKNRLRCHAEDCLKDKQREMHDLKTKLQECDTHVADLDTYATQQIPCIL